MSRRRHFLVAGFDFGTRFSKVVIRDQNTQVSKVVAFPSKSPALYPSCLCLKDGMIFPPENRKEDGQMLHYLKMVSGHCWAGKGLQTGGFKVPSEFERLAIDHGASRAATIVASYYFARVIAEIRTFISRDSDWSGFDFSPGSSDLWAVQVCVPAGLINWDPDVKAKFQEALFIAWEFHTELFKSDLFDISLDRWSKRCLQRLESGYSDTERGELSKRCVTYPEVAAGVQSILRSKNARDGRYITMDVGAGTIDLNIFFRASGQELGSRENARNLDYYSAKVEPLGADHIQEDIGKVHAETVSRPRGLSPRPRKAVMQEVDHAVEQLFRSALAYQPNFGFGEGKRTWDRNTFVYLWGGGSRAEGYRNSLEQALKKSGIAEPEVRLLENPEELQTPSSVDFGRLAVAYGLSHYIVNLESVRLPKQLRTFSERYPELSPDTLEDYSASSSQSCHCRGKNPSCYSCHGKGFIERETSRQENLSRAAATQKLREKRLAREAAQQVVRRPTGPQATKDQRQNLERITLSYTAAGDKIAFEEVCRSYLKIAQIGNDLKRHGVRTMPDEYESAIRVFSNETNRRWRVGVTADWTHPSSGRVEYKCHRLHCSPDSPLRRIRILSHYKTLREILEKQPIGTVLQMEGCLVFKKAIPPNRKRKAKPATIMFKIKDPKDFIVAS